MTEETIPEEAARREIEQARLDVMRAIILRHYSPADEEVCSRPVVIAAFDRLRDLETAAVREEFEAYKREVSEALRQHFGDYIDMVSNGVLGRFILPEPVDPLVEDPIDALVDLLAPVLTHSQGMAAKERESRFRAALAALKRGIGGEA